MDSIKKKTIFLSYTNKMLCFGIFLSIYPSIKFLLGILSLFINKRGKINMRVLILTIVFSESLIVINFQHITITHMHDF